MVVSAVTMDPINNLNQSLQNGISKFDKECLRAIQREAFQCSAKCCEDKASSIEAVRSCVASCHRESNGLEQNVKDEIERIQDRLTRCAQQCNDEYTDRISKDGDSTALAGAEADKCLTKCCESHSKLIPELFARLRSKTKSC